MAIRRNRDCARSVITVAARRHAIASDFSPRLPAGFHESRGATACGKATCRRPAAFIRLTAANLRLKPQAITCRRSATHRSQRATCNVQRAGKSKSVLSTNGSSNSGEYQYSQIGILFRDCSIEQLTFLCGLRSTVFAAGPDVVCGEASSDIESLRSQRA